MSSGPTALNAHDLISVGALVHYLYVATGLPVKSTWLTEIKAGDYASWPGLTYSNDYKYCPNSVESLQGHLTQSRQIARSTKLKPDPVPRPLMTKSKYLYITTEPISKLYTDYMGVFLLCSRRGNNFIMLSYHVDTNVILVEPFESRHNRHRLASADRIMTRLTKRGHCVDLQILDNEYSAAYKLYIDKKWGAKFQLVPPDVHQCNISERAIRTFKAHFLAILAGVSDSFPNYLWDQILPQKELTLNILCQSNIAM